MNNEENTRWLNSNTTQQRKYMQRFLLFFFFFFSSAQCVVDGSHHCRDPGFVSHWDVPKVPYDTSRHREKAKQKHCTFVFFFFFFDHALQWQLWYLNTSPTGPYIMKNCQSNFHQTLLLVSNVINIINHSCHICCLDLFSALWLLL